MPPFLKRLRSTRRVTYLYSDQPLVQELAGIYLHQPPSIVFPPY